MNTGSHEGLPDLGGKTEGRRPPASGFPTVEDHGILDGGSKAQRGQGIYVRSPSQLTAKLKS